MAGAAPLLGTLWEQSRALPSQQVGEIEGFQSKGQQWRTNSTREGDVKVRAVPFDAIQLDLSSLWADIRRREEP